MKTRLILTLTLLAFPALFTQAQKIGLEPEVEAKPVEVEANPKVQMVNAYIATPTAIADHRLFAADADSVEGKQTARLAEHILAKPTLVKADLVTLNAIATENKELMRSAEKKALLDSRVDELMALSDAKGFPLRERKYNGLYRVKDWVSALTVAEWLDVSTTEIDPALFLQMQERILAKATEALMEKGTGDEAAVVAALNAPLFAGLAEALLPLGINVTMPDYTALVARTPALIDRCKLSQADATRSWFDARHHGVPVGPLGSVMFVKGTTAYNAWKDTLGLEYKLPPAMPVVAMDDFFRKLVFVWGRPVEKGYMLTLLEGIYEAKLAGDVEAYGRLTNSYTKWADKAFRAKP